MHYFIVLVIISVCVKCFNIDVRMYSTSLLPPPPPPLLCVCVCGGGGVGGRLSSCFFCHFDTDVCIYSTCAFLIVKRILIIVDNVQRSELVNFYGVQR